MSTSAGALTEELKRRASALGFGRVGVAAARPLPEEAAHLERWLQAGYQGSLAYMARSKEVRADPTLPGMLAGAKNVVALATPYASIGEPLLFPVAGIARYALRRDYHAVLTERLATLKAWLVERGFRARYSVDSKPVLERAWARLSGIGYIGKNSLLIVPGLGSYVLLSTLITDAELVADRPITSVRESSQPPTESPESPGADLCGPCRICLEHCPTGALVEPRVVDVRRCVSFLTKDQSGAIDLELRPRLNGWIFGCDRCQQVCPHNSGGPAQGTAGEVADSANLPRLDAAAILQMDPVELDKCIEGTQLQAAGREKLARNAAIALGTSGRRDDLIVLRKIAATDPSPVVREHAQWAIERIGI
jgi:epoxyqueuosine reductase